MVVAGGDPGQARPIRAHDEGSLPVETRGSACETALGRHVGGEGLVGLAYPFLQVGARCLLLTLWNVDDRATALLMERFYDNWSSGMSKARSLQQAKSWLREYTDADGWRPYEHPYYWAAFILYGDAS